MVKVKAVILAFLTLFIAPLFCFCKEVANGSENDNKSERKENYSSVNTELLYSNTVGGSEEQTFLGALETDAAEGTEISAGEELNVVALGDSIARGYGLRYPESQCFPRLLANMIRQVEGKEVGYLNYAVDGHKSSDLLALLENGGVMGLEDADLVVVCIGANNILTVFTDALMSFFEKNDIKVNGDEHELFTGTDMESKAGEGSEGERGIEDYEVFFSELNAFLSGEEFESKMQKGIDELKVELPKIIEYVLDRSPNATLELMTVYNPFRGFYFGIEYIDTVFDLETLADKWVKALNSVIRNVARSKESTVVIETYEPFWKSNEKLLNAGFSPSPLSLSVDPHPNARGHRLIAELYFEKFNNK